MFNINQIIAIVEKTLPDVVVKAWTQYNDLYLVRVERSLEGEEDFDPFYSVNSNTGEVLEFSVFDIGGSKFDALTWTDI